jgi:hypothetical protein
MGCVFSQCAGFPIACGDQPTEERCAQSVGCSWDGARCTGTAQACGTFTEPPACSAQPGCVFVPRARCTGEAIACTRLRAETCESQPGCRIPRDGGPPGPPDAGPLPECMVPDGGLPPGCIAPEPLRLGGCNAEQGIECDGDWTGQCDPACGAGECCARRDGVFQCVAATEGECPAADIFIDTTMIAGLYTFDYLCADDATCAVEEGCLTGPGNRRLMRFDTWTPNLGSADLFLGDPESELTSELFELSECHGHYHFNSYAEYELLSEDACCVAAVGHKQAFCLLDLAPYPGGGGSETAAYNCSFQGIQRGWQDIYGSGLDCQWIDITGVPPGNYLLRIRLNVEHILAERNYENNEAVIPVTIPEGDLGGGPCSP